MKRAFPRMIVLTLSVILGFNVAPIPTAQAETYTAAYIRMYAPSAQSVERSYGVPSSVALAQSILETGWGQSGLTLKAKNFFGIKCSRNYVSQHQLGCYSVETKEYYPKTGWTTIVAPFRTYASSTNSFLDYGQFLRENSRYSQAFLYQRDYKQFITEVHKAGYATDPNYAKTVISIIQQYGLNKYDLIGKMAWARPLNATTTRQSAWQGADPLVAATAPKLTFAQVKSGAVPASPAVRRPASAIRQGSPSTPPPAPDPQSLPAAQGPAVRVRPLASTGRC